MQHINLLWTYDKGRFGGLLNSVISRAADLLQRHLAHQALDKEALQRLFLESFRRNLQHPVALEVRKSYLLLVPKDQQLGNDVVWGSTMLLGIASKLMAVWK